MPRSIPVVEAQTRALPELTKEDRFLLEGLQQTTLGGIDYLAGVMMERGKNSREGGLFFYDPQSRKTQVVSMAGNPGMFRPVEGFQGKFFVALARQFGILTVDGTWAGRFEPFFEAPTGFVDGVNIVANDGTIINPRNRQQPSQVIQGFKHRAFDLSNPGGCLLQVIGTRCSALWANEVCPNGTVLLRTSRPTLLHIETASRTLKAASYHPETGKFDLPSVIFDFARPDNFPPEFRERTLYPDGMFHWRNDQGKEMLIISIFDPDPHARDGVAFQFEVMSGNRLRLVCIYRIPCSPRVTCPTLATIDGKVVVCFVSASEGLLDTRGNDDPNIGALHFASGEQCGINIAPRLEQYRTVR